jgi:hypothetical protein
VGQPGRHRSPSHAEATGKLFALQPLLAERDHLLVPLIPFGLMRRVGLSVGSQHGCWGCLISVGSRRFLRLLFFAESCAATRQCFFYRFSQLFA